MSLSLIFVLVLGLGVDALAVFCCGMRCCGWTRRLMDHIRRWDTRSVASLPSFRAKSACTCLSSCALRISSPCALCHPEAVPFGDLLFFTSRPRVSFPPLWPAPRSHSLTLFHYAQMPACPA